MPTTEVRIPEVDEVIRAAVEWRRAQAHRSVTAAGERARTSAALTAAVDAYNWRLAEHGVDR